MNNQSIQLDQAVERLLAADADYKAFVRTTKSHQLACQGAREAAMKIKTEYWAKPDPCRDFDWCAYDDNTYDGPGSIAGWGPTEQDAICDLLNNTSSE